MGAMPLVSRHLLPAVVAIDIKSSARRDTRCEHQLLTAVAVRK